MFERFSSRFSTVIPNPGIGPERAVNYELGVEGEWAEHVRFEGALFYNDIQNALVSVSVVSAPRSGCNSKPETSRRRTIMAAS